MTTAATSPERVRFRRQSPRLLLGQSERHSILLRGGGPPASAGGFQPVSTTYAAGEQR